MLYLIFLIFLACGFIVTQEKQVLCRSPYLELFSSSCGSSTETLIFGVEPCYLNGFSKWNGTIFWIPKRDLTFFRTIVTLRYESKKVLEWKQVLCTGEDDDYTYCGALKGETVNTTVRLSGAKANYPMGEYTATIKGYSGHSEADLFVCINITLVLKNESSYNFG